jgi:hypothetical protein
MTRFPFPFVFVLKAAVAFGSVQTDLEVFPETAALTGARDQQSFVVRVTEPSGLHRDVTGEAKFSVKDAAKARFSGAIVTPVADGETSVEVEFSGRKVSVPLTVKDATVTSAISFRRDVMPVFMKGECNRCHGATRGQDGFRLSLWGFDPEGDHYRLTREFPGRRINTATPDASMVITKADGSAPHTGGKRFEKNSRPWKTLYEWIDAGAPNDGSGVPECVSVTLLPGKLVLANGGQTFRLTVLAKYSDGTDRDVTDMALYLSSNDASAKVDADGIVTTGQAGEAFVMARFGTHTVGSQTIVIAKGQDAKWPADVAELTWVDRFVHDKLRNLRITPSGIASDEVFLRRAYIDIVGMLPNPQDLKNFLADKDPDKRRKIIDILLERDEFVDLWALKWSELLQIRTPQNLNNGYKSAFAYYKWLHNELKQSVPMNEIARKLITASGSSIENAAANYYTFEQDPMKLAEDTAQAFFGIRIQCAQCHNHPFDRWTMDDYRGFVAFFTQVGRKEGEDPRERIIFNTGGGESRHPVGNRVVKPKFLGGIEPELAGRDRREVLGDWVADAANPYFARHISNLIWAQYMGRGIVEPVDDVRISNPSVNPELLDALAQKLVEYNFDLRRIVRDICNSRTYQLSTRANETNALDDRNFAKASIRRMRAEVLLDTITQVTETKDKYRGLPMGARAVEIADGKTTNYFLTTFGRADRETICSREEVGPTLSQALHLLNGDTIEGKIAAGGVIRRLTAADLGPREVVEDLYLRTFSRRPTEEELLKLEPHWGVTEERPKVYHDVFWALLNAKEFMFNH